MSDAANRHPPSAPLTLAFAVADCDCVHTFILCSGRDVTLQIDKHSVIQGFYRNDMTYQNW